MRRAWFGLGVLAALLALSLWAGWTLERQVSPVCRELTAAAELAGADRWPEAVGAADRAEAHWRRHWRRAACLADHSALEEIDALFGELGVSGARREEPDFSAACARLLRLTRAVYQAHRLTWWDLL